jgi:hypothetical protein
LTSATLVLALVALLVILAVPAVASAAGHRPVVASVSPNTGTQAGNFTVVVTGQYFKFRGHNAVDSVTFGSKKAKKVHVLSATKLQCTAPAGTSGVYVRVTTFKGTSKRTPTAKFIYVGPAATMTLNAGTNQTASAGTTVPVAPSVLVKDAKNRPVPGVTVTFAVASGGGSVTGGDATTDASGIATVGGWKLGGTAGANTLSATSAGLAGSPVGFFATGDAGILTVKQAGTPVRSYSLAELKALTPFAGWAGLGKSPAIGPDAVTGVKIATVVQDALGTPLAATQSVNVAEVDSTPYNKVMSYDLLTNMTGVTFFTTSDLVNPVTTYTGPMAAILIYSDPAGLVMKSTDGPLRFAAADATNEGLVFKPTSLSVSKVNVLDIVTP